MESIHCRPRIRVNVRISQVPLDALHQPLRIRESLPELWSVERADGSLLVADVVRKEDLTRARAARPSPLAGLERLLALRVVIG